MSAFITTPAGAVPSARPHSGTRRVSGRRPALRMASSPSAARDFFVGGNWKCNGSSASIAALIEALNAGPSIAGEPVQVVCAPPFPYLAATRGALREDWDVSAQNCWIQGTGAYTGEVAVDMIKDCGAGYVILGHSERRHIPQIRESDQQIADKTKFALDQGLRVILCIGELLEEREAGQTLAVCERQLKAVAAVISDWSNVVVAYEPVWAIGTGKVASPEQAQEVHENVRKWIAANVGADVAASLRILYGGSVSSKNCEDLAKNPDVDGFLVGGASLKPDFLDIVNSYKIKLASTV